jgi:hypothetical protein
MPDENKEGQKPATDDASKASTDGAAETHEETKQEPELADLLADKRVQAEIDRRVTAAMQKAESKAADREKAAAEKARREAQEARLLEKEDLKGLLDLKTKAAEEAQAKLEQYERDQKVQSLLDKKAVTDPALRAVWLRFNGDLTELDAAIDAFQAGINASVEKIVNERLKTTAPPKGDQTKKEAALTLDQQIAAAETAGNWAESLRLKNAKVDAMHKQQRVAAAAPPPG